MILKLKTLANIHILRDFTQNRGRLASFGKSPVIRRPGSEVLQ